MEFSQEFIILSKLRLVCNFIPRAKEYFLFTKWNEGKCRDEKLEYLISYILFTH